MPLVTAAVCPHPPVLIPEVAAGAAGELDDLRRACDTAVSELICDDADTVVVVGVGGRTRWMPADAFASFVPFGVSIEFPLGSGQSGASARAVAPTATHAPGLAMTQGSGFAVAEGPGPAASRAPGFAMTQGSGPAAGRTRLPLSLAVGAWLLARGPRELPVEAVSVARDADGAECAGVAARLRDRPDRVALLVMGDGSACRGDAAPGRDDQRARPYDDEVARALAAADVAALRGLDRVLSAELLVAGWAPWQVLAGCASGPWCGRLSYYAAPYGVAYFVASWERP